MDFETKLALTLIHKDILEIKKMLLEERGLSTEVVDASIKIHDETLRSIMAVYGRNPKEVMPDDRKT